MIDIPTPASVRRKLIEQFEAEALFKRDLGTALYHFCVALELIPTPISDNPDLAMAKGRHAIEASMRAIPTIFRLCPATPVPSSLAINPAALAEALELVEFASRFDQMMSRRPSSKRWRSDAWARIFTPKADGRWRPGWQRS
jgi:hypothetical protein